MKSLIPFKLALLLVSCVGSEKAAKSIQNDDGPVVQIRLDKVVAMKGYNSYNQTLSNATGIKLGAVKGEFERIKSSLPATHDVEGFNEFNQIAIARLSYAYCSRFVEEDTVGSMSNSQMADYFLNSFLDYEQSNPTPSHSALRAELIDLMNNDQFTATEPDGSTGSSRLINGTNPTKSEIGIVACSALLSSSYFTAML